MIPGVFLKEHITAGEGYNRWFIPPAAISMHMCIGSVYSWSIFNAPLCRELGGVVSAADDWALSSVVPCFSTGIVFLGLSAAIAGQWLERVGPRATGLLSAACWSAGHCVAGVGVLTHQLPLVVAGYGVLGGIGLGLGYVSPVGTLLRWFPDRRGMATGFAVAGFGGGAIVAAPLNKALLDHYYRPPEYVGRAEDCDLITDSGRRFVEVAGELKEVVVAQASDLTNLPASVGLQEGVYYVGTGTCGAAETFFTLAGTYAVIMSMAALALRVPREGWTPEGWTPPTVEEEEEEAGSGGAHRKEPQRSSFRIREGESVHIADAPKTPQFWMLWTALGCNISAGIGIIGCATTMMRDIFQNALPEVVDTAFLGYYVSGIGVASIVGRLGWGSASDFLGRKTTFATFFGLGIPMYLSIPYAAAEISAHPGSVPLMMFCGSSLVIFSMYGGAFATIPAYLADVFGTAFVGGIHGRLLTAWSTAGVAGPMTIATLRQRSADSAITDLAHKVDGETFERTFGCPQTELPALMEAKTVTIDSLMAIVPPGTVDPTPFLYDTTMYTMAGLLGVAAVANGLMGPVNAKWHMSNNRMANKTL